MPVSAQIIKDSISEHGPRLTTMLLRYPRFIHAEFMTHRVFSRNASSSRAIPVERFIADLRRDPALPLYWGAAQPGMQADEEIPLNQRSDAKDEWLRAMESAIRHAENLRRYNLHKQIANRVLEPFVHINVVVTATDWGNFWELRCHKDAQPEIKALADAMLAAYTASEPRLLQPGQWHMPFVTEEDYDVLLTSPDETLDSDPEGIQNALKVSVARCARTSYLTHDGKRPTVASDLLLYKRLVGSRPLHASPAEHQGTPDIPFWENRPAPFNRSRHITGWGEPDKHGNFTGFIQYRKLIE